MGLVALSSCNPSGEVTPTRDAPTAVRSSSAAPTAVPSQATPEASCDALRTRFEAAARSLEKRCRADADCQLMGSDHNCYAPHGPTDDLAPLKAVDDAMEAARCPQVECEPPPPQACRDGRCRWAL